MYIYMLGDVIICSSEKCNFGKCKKERERIVLQYMIAVVRKRPR